MGDECNGYRGKDRGSRDGWSKMNEERSRERMLPWHCVACYNRPKKEGGDVAYMLVDNPTSPLCDFAMFFSF